MNLTSTSHTGHQLDLHDGSSRQSSLERLGSCSYTMAALGCPALISKTPWTHGGRPGEKTEAEAEAEAELEEGKTELGNFEDNSAGVVERAAE